MVVKVAGDALTVEAHDINDKLIDSFTIRKQDGVHDKAYLASVLPEEVVTLHNALHRAIRATASGAPGMTDPADVTFTNSGLKIDFPTKLALSLDEKSQDAYAVEPAVWEPDPTSNKADKFTFKVRARKKVTADRRGKLSPPLVFTCRYKLGKIEGSVAFEVRLQQAKH